jgi:molybdenum cofactor biosynthesis enzyme MoaA
MKIDVIEIELSSLCNARCSDCMRTKLDNKKISYFKGNLSLKQIKQNFYNLDMKDTKIKLCGVLGDPMLNPELELIIEYFIFNKNVKNIEMSTNGGAKTKDFWKNLGELSKMSNKKFVVHWSIDGVTRNDYRENVNINKVWENVNTYNQAGGLSVWQYILFDYNFSELTLAKKIADEKGMTFLTRNSWRNNSESAKHNKSTNSKELDVNSVESIKQKILDDDYDSVNIKCRHKIKNEIFISVDNKLWPCCHLYDENVKEKSIVELGLSNVFNNYGNNFNDLNIHSLTEILNSEWYLKTLVDGWNKNSKFHVPRCWFSCGDGGKRSVIKEKL